ncbi:hypothetical protein BDQ12DRAFT_694455 [Crucibulum laeve]|uniref:Uncharacterized protein n=1 Tax=Crucibulum laeve TaxID=68775 RepID=A0A5C3LEL1_9AGAR|nr:hypothetical protein BDQ12DRAFT_694455 [Crucibulum laeve]
MPPLAEFPFFLRFLKAVYAHRVEFVACRVRCEDRITRPVLPSQNLLLSTTRSYYTRKRSTPSTELCYRRVHVQSV